EAVKLVRWLSPEETAARLAAVRKAAAAIPSANGKLATIGFCWGGGRGFAAAGVGAPPPGAGVYSRPTPGSAPRWGGGAPVLAHYGGDDARVDVGIPTARAALKEHRVPYESYVYPGAGHGFLRQQADRDGANQKAAAQSWPRTIAFLRAHLK